MLTAAGWPCDWKVVRDSQRQCRDISSGESMKQITALEGDGHLERVGWRDSWATRLTGWRRTNFITPL